AEHLRDQGYATGHFGKWHLGPEPYSPLQHGFDVDLPHHPGPGPAGSYVAPWKFRDFDHDPEIPDEHIEDRMAKEAVAFMEEHATEPFFLNYWMFSVHAPFDAKKDLIDEYRARVDPNDPQRSPTYAAMIESMDDAVGTLLDTLDRLGIADNTIIVFASDNGGNMYNEVDGTTPTSNAPLRGGKATMFEGGVRGPAIFVQPDRVAAGSRSDAIIQSCDFYPTLLEMLEFSPYPGQQFDGISIVPALDGGELQRDGIFTYFPHTPGVPDWLPPSVSVHHQNWKLIRIFHEGESGRHRYKLFDLDADLGEKTNLADTRPDVVKRLDALIDQHLEDTGAALPLPNPKFDPEQYDLAAEGVPTIRNRPSKSTKPTNKAKQPLVAGWRAAGTCTISIGEEGLLVDSEGTDPHFSARLPTVVQPETLVLEWTMTSTSSGSGRVYWSGPGAPFNEQRSREFDPLHDGKTHRYSVEFEPTAGIDSVRIDPSRGTGTMSVQEIQLRRRDATVIHAWSF
ncbi:MAG: sulfatase-like hydrolase/transferase, partial [Planctomycetota bacterium]